MRAHERFNKVTKVTNTNAKVGCEEYATITTKRNHAGCD